MRTAFSLLISSLAFLFSLNANAYNFESNTGYQRCIKTYPDKLDNCNSILLFSRKAFIDSQVRCPISTEGYASITAKMNAAGCGGGELISVKCIKTVEGQLSDLIGSFCKASANQQNASNSSGSPGSNPAGTAVLPPPGSSPAVTNTSKPKENGFNLGSLGEAAKGLFSNGKKSESKTDVAKAEPRNKNAGEPLAEVDANTGIGKEINQTIRKVNESLARDKAKAEAEASPFPTAGNEDGSGGPTSRAPYAAMSDPSVSSGSDYATGDTAQTFPYRDPANGPAPMPAATKPIPPAEFSQATQATKVDLPGAAGAADQVNDIATGDILGEGAVGEASAASQGPDSSLRAEGAQAEQQAQILLAGMTQFNISAPKFTQLKIDLEKYVNVTKKACVAAADRAAFICMESTSPGVQSVKSLVDVAGPALGMISAAQKACSSTANLTKLAAMGLTAAKGACVAMKLMCDTTCATATKDLATIKASVQAMPGMITQEYNLEQAECFSTYSTPATATLLSQCIAEINKKLQSAAKEVASAEASLAKESAPTPGTSPALVAKCQSHMKDIALLAANILGTMNAQKSAKECADKLATNAGGAQTPQLYCSLAQNANTNFCQCQKDNTKAGCPGAIVAKPVTTFADPKNPNDPNGSDQRNKNGASQFAGSGTNGKIGAGAIGSGVGGLGGLDGAGGLGSGTNKDAGKDSLAGVGGLPSGAGSGGGSGTAGGAGGGSSDPEKSKGDESDKKKWSFGGFASAFGGGSGGFGFGGKNGAGSGLGKKDMNAKRDIASEKLRAGVSQASGKSNWEKVRDRYLIKSPTLLDR